MAIYIFQEDCNFCINIGRLTEVLNKPSPYLCQSGVQFIKTVLKVRPQHITIDNLHNLPGTN